MLKNRRAQTRRWEGEEGRRGKCRRRKRKVLPPPTPERALRQSSKPVMGETERDAERERESKQDYNQSCILCGLFVVLMPFLLLPLLLLHIYATNPRFFFFLLHYGYCLAVPCCSLTHTQKHTQTHTWEVKFAAFWSLRSFACTLLCRFPFSCLFAKWIFLLLFMFHLHLNTISEYPAHFSMEYIGFLWLNVNISCYKSSTSLLLTLCTDIILFVLALSTLFIVLCTVLQKQVCTALKKYFKKSKTIFSLSYF